MKFELEEEEYNTEDCLSDVISDVTTSEESCKSDKRAVVIDNGSYKLRAGLSGFFEPICEMRSLVGHLVATESKEFGDFALRNHHKLQLQHPIKGVDDVNWKDLSDLWMHVFEEYLEIDVSDHDVIMSESVVASRQQRERTLEVLIESMRFGGVLLRSQAQLAMTSQQLETGVVVNCGYHGSQVVGIYEGYQLNYSANSLEIGGEVMSEVLRREVRSNRGIAFNSVAEKEVINSIKENLAYVITRGALPQQPQEVELPDARSLLLGDELWKCSEVFFDPHLIGSSSPALPQLIIDSIRRVPDDALRSRNGIEVLLCGSVGCGLPGLAERLQDELDDVIKDARVRKAECGSDAAWIGGSILGDQCDHLQDLMVDAERYAEYGSRIVSQIF